MGLQILSTFLSVTHTHKPPPKKTGGNWHLQLLDADPEPDAFQHLPHTQKAEVCAPSLRNEPGVGTLYGTSLQVIEINAHLFNRVDHK